MGESHRCGVPAQREVNPRAETAEEDETTPARLRGPGSPRYRHRTVGLAGASPRGSGGRPRRANHQSVRSETPPPPKTDQSAGCACGIWLRLQNVPSTSARRGFGLGWKRRRHRMASVSARSRASGTDPPIRHRSPLPVPDDLDMSWRASCRAIGIRRRGADHVGPGTSTALVHVGRAACDEAVSFSKSLRETNLVGVRSAQPCRTQPSVVADSWSRT